MTRGSSGGVITGADADTWLRDALARALEANEHGEQTAAELRAENDPERCSMQPEVSRTDQEHQPVSVILKVHQQVPGLLRHPRTRRVAGDPGQVNAPAAGPDD